MMQSLSGLSAISNDYDAILLDLWGVVHDGSKLYPGVHEALAELKKAGKKIIMLSNAPRRSARAEKRLNELGVGPELYDAVVTSGEVGYQWLKAGDIPWGKKYFYIGMDNDDKTLLDNLPQYKRVATLEEADFLLNIGYGDGPPKEDWTPTLQGAAKLKKPMLCLNPDLEVVKQSGDRYPCAGIIAKEYEALGGVVRSFGKPHTSVYEHCMTLLYKSSPLEGEGRVGGGAPSSMEDRPLPLTPSLKGRGKSRILMIGDSLETDIPGAKNFGIDSILVTGGLLKEKKPHDVQALCREAGLNPTYVMPGLVWNAEKKIARA